MGTSQVNGVIDVLLPADKQSEICISVVFAGIGGRSYRVREETWLLLSPRKIIRIPNSLFYYQLHRFTAFPDGYFEQIDTWQKCAFFYDRLIRAGTQVGAD